MLDWLYSAFGSITFEAFSLGLTFLNTQYCCFLFSRNLKKRDHFLTRVAISMVLGLAFCIVLAALKTAFNNLFVRILCYMLIFDLNFIVCYACYQDSWDNRVLSFCTGQAANQIVMKLYPLLQNILGVNDRITVSLFRNESAPSESEWLIYFGFLYGGIWLLSLFFRPKTRLTGDKTVMRRISWLSVFITLVVTVLICVARVYEAESFALNIVVKLFSIFFGCLVLALCSGILSQNDKNQQINILQQLWKQDMAQFESVKANMDVINMKCHDLKHILRSIEDKLTVDEASALQEALQFYDSNIQTGNEVLDVVLHEKALLCQKHGIRLSCMVDGKQLGFLTPVQTYTLFGNIIDNAVEAVQKCQDPDSKYITLVCQQQGAFLEIEQSNYFHGELKLEDDLPATVKEDSARHGFGIKSIKFIAEQYGGTLSIQIQDDMFFLRICFPIAK